jgi:hypothetical protein
VIRDTASAVFDGRQVDGTSNVLPDAAEKEIEAQ